jgi:hypothetical protein
MRLVQAESDPSWALVDEGDQSLRRVASGLAGWAPRIACGEGAWALPINGRLADSAAPTLERGLFGRVLTRPSPPPNFETGLAAVIGAVLLGRRNPLHSVCGYMATCERAGDLSFGPVLVTRAEFGDAPLDSARDADGRAFDMIDHLLRLDLSHRLRTGDVVLLGPTLVPDRLRQRLQVDDLVPASVFYARPLTERRQPARAVA